MSKCKSLICDVCGQHVEDDEGALFIRAKRRWYSWADRGFYREKLCICLPCQEKLQTLMQTIEVQEADAEAEEKDEGLAVVQGFQAKEE